MKKPIDATHINEEGNYFKFDSYNVFEWIGNKWK